MITMRYDLGVCACVLSRFICVWLCNPVDSSLPSSLSIGFYRQNTGVDCHAFLQGILEGSPGLQCRLILYHWARGKPWPHCNSCQRSSMCLIRRKKRKYAYTKSCQFKITLINSQNAQTWSDQHTSLECMSCMSCMTIWHTHFPRALTLILNTGFSYLKSFTDPPRWVHFWSNVFTSKKSCSWCTIDNSSVSWAAKLNKRLATRSKQTSHTPACEIRMPAS